MLRQRLHLFEFNDHERTPAALRDVLIESLSRILEQNQMLDALAPKVDAFLTEAGTRSLLDLGSGAGGPALSLCASMERAGLDLPDFLLTDLFPRPVRWAEATTRYPATIRYVDAPVDATRLPAELGEGRARLVINAFHHFGPGLADAVLADAIKSRAPFFIAESFERTPFGFLPFALLGPSVMLTAPLWSKEAKLKKAFLTWFTPIALLISLWDGLVSTARVYDEAELRAMVGRHTTSYRLEYGTFPIAPFGRGCYFFGVPSQAVPG